MEVLEMSDEFWPYDRGDSIETLNLLCEACYDEEGLIT